ncbi:MAG TPA: AraC family transcriptional regulator [Thermoanaerobaculia bacterium]
MKLASLLGADASLSWTGEERRPGGPGGRDGLGGRGVAPPPARHARGVTNSRRETQLQEGAPPVVTYFAPGKGFSHHDRDDDLTTGMPVSVFASPELNAKAREINWRSFEYYPSLDRIKRYTEEHYREEIPLPCAADIAGMEATYFSAFFRKKIGIRYTDWLGCLRVAHAIRLLRSRDRPIADIAQAVGFNDLRTFERNFKRITHTTARRFKERVRPA